jgi:hypothetical protein
MRPWRIVAGLAAVGALALGAVTPLQQVEARVRNIERQLAALFTYQNDTTPPVDLRDGTTLAGTVVAVGDLHPTVTLGPFYISDLAGTATEQATLGFFNTATALSRGTNDIKLNATARVVGLYLVSDAARTAGTATARVRIAGTGTTFSGGSVQLNGTDTTSDSDFVLHTSGLAVSVGQTVGCDVVTSGWTPTTADVACWVVVSYD